MRGSKKSMFCVTCLVNDPFSDELILKNLYENKECLQINQIKKNIVQSEFMDNLVYMKV